MPSDLGIIEEAVDIVARHCLACGMSPRTARFRLRVALCEALSNAIVYGNDLHADRRADVTVVVNDHTAAVRVTDEGDGFDPDQVADPTTPERIETDAGRGLFLIRQLVDDVSFNDRGNSICMILNLD